jgi:DNA invertase Pin-like site-specific DNA recombinase
VRTVIYVRHSFDQIGTEAELLRKSAEGRGDTVIASFSDDPAILGRGKYAGWNAMLSDLDNIDQIVVGCAGDLPGRTVRDLLAIVSILQGNGVRLRLHRGEIDTDSGPAALLDLITAYRHAKVSQAIKAGLEKARRTGKILGRPRVPDHIRGHIQIAVADGGGIRPTARMFGVSPATVVNIRKSMLRVEPERMAA